MTFVDTQTVPAPFEKEFEFEALFMMRVFATGGKFKRRKNDDKELPPPREVPRNAFCPCGSGNKAKKCHSPWTTKDAGYAE